MNRLQEIDLESWRKSHPRSSKWYPDWYVDFNPNGSTKDGRYSWSTAMLLIWQRDGRRCRLCGDDGKEQRIKDKFGNWFKDGLEVHHIIPRSKGGTNHAENLITFCRKCHSKTFKKGYTGVPTIPMGDQAQLTSFS